VKISIVTLSLNQRAYLQQAIDSVLSQRYPELEYILVDPGSQDGSRELISGYGNQIAATIFEPDRGAADGLNRAFGKATGDLFGYLNADDFYLPGCFRSAAKAALKVPGAAAIYADGYKTNAEGKVMRRVVSTGFSARRFVYGGALVLQQSTFYRAAAFREAGGFNVQNRTSWDAELLLNMSLRSMQLAHVPGYWSVFRVHPESITGSQRLADESRLTHARYFKTVTGREKTWLDRLLSRFVLGYTLLTEPRGLAVRVADRIWQSGSRLHPAQLHEQKIAF
jgi:glycosyltransferase involved in cell wall biosynthesis